MFHPWAYPLCRHFLLHVQQIYILSSHRRMAGYEVYCIQSITQLYTIQYKMWHRPVCIRKTLASNDLGWKLNLIGFTTDTMDWNVCKLFIIQMFGMGAHIIHNIREPW